MIIFLFPVVSFLSALLLFLVQPIIGKELLPLFGGTPSVWTTTMFFFQVQLLLGYIYSHLLIRYVRGIASPLLHTLVLTTTLVLLPIGVDGAHLTESSPVVTLLALLVTSVGGPFFVLSTTSPLLQAWYGWRFPRKDPYYLYAASNLGSAAAVILYPLVIEPTIGLKEQREWWSILFVILLGLIIVCQLSGRAVDTREELVDAPPIQNRERILWLVLSLCPASLSLGVTAHLTAELAPVPLLWMIPLLLYLMTFVIAFSSWKVRGGESLFLLLLIAVLITWALSLSQPLWFLVPLHLSVLFLGALLCHSRLSDNRPAVQHLTQFYLFIALGGVCGAVVNTVVGPLLFTTHLEYPLILIAISFLVLPKKREKLVVELGYLVLISVVGSILISMSHLVGIEPVRVVVLVLGGIGIITFFHIQNGYRYVSGCLALLISGSAYDGLFGELIDSERNFFGTLSVTASPDKRFRFLVHGATVHGMEATGAFGHCTPLSYYHATGPAGDLLSLRDDAPLSVGLIGVGTGSLVCYARPKDSWDLFEINPAVITLAQQYFSFLSARKEAELRYIIGDGRLELAKRDSAYDVIIVDAFSSDSIPVHLLTKEAFLLYRSKLKSRDGMILIHISNRFLDLAPIIARASAAAGLLSFSSEEPGLKKEESDAGKYSSDWMVVTGKVPTSSRIGWRRVTADENRPWSDDYANLLEALK